MGFVMGSPLLSITLLNIGEKMDSPAACAAGQSRQCIYMGQHDSLSHDDDSCMKTIKKPYWVFPWFSCMKIMEKPWFFKRENHGKTPWGFSMVFMHESSSCDNESC